MQLCLADGLRQPLKSVHAQIELSLFVCFPRNTLPMCLQDTNKVLAISRIMVAWQPLGLAMGTYDMCNRYLQQRQQFGSPLAAFQVHMN